MVEVMVDRRVKRTRKLLREAVLELAEACDLTELTVQEITRCADVNRATFYQHYRDKDALIEETIDSLLDELFAECGPVLAGIERLTPETAHPSVAFMFRQVGRRAGLYRRLLGNGGSAYFVTRFLARNEELFLRVWRLLDRPQDGRQPPPEMRARFAASACLGLFSIWLERGRLESADVMADWFWRLARPAWFETAFPDGDLDGAPPQR